MLVNSVAPIYNLIKCDSSTLMTLVYPKRQHSKILFLIPLLRDILQPKLINRLITLIANLLLIQPHIVEYFWFQYH